VCALFVLALGARAEVVVEDFKDPNTGFDLSWTEPASNNLEEFSFTSNGEIGKLAFTANGQIGNWGLSQFAAGVPWDPATQKYAQIMVPYLGFGHGARVSCFLGGDATELFPHDIWLEQPGQGPRPQTFDIGALVSGSEPTTIIFRLEVLDYEWGQPGDAIFAVDWLKVGIDASAAPEPGTPGFVGPADGASLSENPPTMSWSAPDGFTNNLYTVTYSQDPYFMDETTVTVLDGVTGTSYTPPAPLAEGTWYWMVSATNAGRMSGPFLEKGIVPDGDARDPKTHLHYSFKIVGVNAVRDWSLY